MSHDDDDDDEHDNHNPHDEDVDDDDDNNHASISIMNDYIQELASSTLDAASRDTRKTRMEMAMHHLQSHPLSAMTVLTLDNLEQQRKNIYIYICCCLEKENTKAHVSHILLFCFFFFFLYEYQCMNMTKS
jgi:TATA-binding protein-associated factor Taf7